MALDLSFSFLCISFSISLLYILRLATKPSSNSRRLPPGPSPLPIIGNMLELGEQPHRSLARLAQTHGPLMALRLGQVTTIIASSPDMAREILQRHDAVCATRSVPNAVHALRHNERSVVWAPPLDGWRNLRRICSTQLFTPQRLDLNQGLQRQKLSEMVAYISKMSAARQTVEIGRAAFATALNLISNATFSVDLVDINSESSQQFKDLVHGIMKDIGSPNISDFFPSLAALDLLGRRRRLTALFSKVFAIFDEQIDRRIKAMAENPSRSEAHADFLDTLLQFHGQNQDCRLDRDVIKSLLLDLFVAGSDTSSTTVEWAMAELLRKPESMTKAKAELAKEIGAGKELEAADISRLPYLQAIVKETLRLHPPAPLLLPRRAERPVDIGGYVIPEGACILVNVWASGRDGAVWADAEAFMPERFMEKDVDFRGRDFELIPFGAGRRLCPGLPLAFRMVHLMLAEMLHRFEWRLPDGMKPGDLDMSEKFGVTLAMAAPLHAIPYSNS